MAELFSAEPALRRLNPDQYTVAWLAVLPIEAEAALAALDRRHGGTFETVQGDDYIYHAGEINGHNTVIATWPAGQPYGPGSAAALASHVKARFCSIWFALLVGVAAGCPNLSSSNAIQRRDIRLGDVLVCVPEKECSGIVQYDLGRDTDQGFIPNGRLNGPPGIVLSAVNSISLTMKHPFGRGCEIAQHLGNLQESSASDKFAYPGAQCDISYRIDRDEPVLRTSRDDKETTLVWHGFIGSGSSLVRNSRRRDDLRDKYNLIGLEMEAAGVMNVLPTGVIRGVCDYGDRHKNKYWQPYAAATAAAYAKGVLYRIAPKRTALSQNPFQPTRNVHWTVTKPKSAHFIGRSDILDELERIVQNALSVSVPSDQCRIVITGMAGQGKSEICLRLADKVRSLFWGVFWTDVGTEFDAENGFLAIATQLGRPAQTYRDTLRILSSLQDPWLLVLDNADNLKFDYSTYFPSGSFGVIILTSRNNECGFHATITGTFRPLPGLSEIDAQNLLRKTATLQTRGRSFHDEDTAAVLSLLGGNPLALVHAGIYVARRRCFWGDYCRLFKEQQSRLLEFRPIQAEPRHGTLFAAFEASMTNLKSSPKSTGADALDILHLMSFNALSPFPLSIFRRAFEGAQMQENHFDGLESWHIDQLPEFLRVRSAEWDDSRLMDAVSLLEGCALISVQKSETGECVEMHPLVHSWARNRQTEAEQHCSWLKAACTSMIASRSALQSETDNRWSQPHMQAYLSVEMAFMLNSGPRPMISRIITKHARKHLVSWGRFEQIKRLIKAFVKTAGADPSIVSKEWSMVYGLLGAAKWYSRKRPEGIALLEKSIELFEPTTKSEFNDFLYLTDSLAGIYLGSRPARATEAIDTIETALDLVKDAAREVYDGRFIELRSRLGEAYIEKGQPEKAISLLRPLIERELLGHNAHDHWLVWAQSTLAKAYYKNGQEEQATLMLNEAIETKKQQCSYDVGLFKLMDTLAHLHLEHSQFEKSIALFEELRALQKDLLHESDYGLLTREHFLALCYWRFGRYEDGHRLMKHVVQVQKRTFSVEKEFRCRSEAVLKFMKRNMSLMARAQPGAQIPPNDQESVTGPSVDSREGHQSTRKVALQNPRAEATELNTRDQRVLQPDDSEVTKCDSIEQSPVMDSSVKAGKRPASTWAERAKKSKKLRGDQTRLRPNSPALD